MKRKDHIKGDDIKDPEKAMQKDKEKKRAAALNAFKVSRAEFVVWYGIAIGGEPEWSHPAVGWLFAAWVAGEGEREWLTEEEKAALVKKQEANLKRAAKQAENKRLAQEAAARIDAKKKVAKKAASKKVAKKVVKKVAKKK
jgi:hypothetical protein